MSSRRDFIKQASIAGSAFLLAPSDLFRNHKGIGLQLYTLRDEVSKDLRSTIARIAEIGFTDVETFGYGGGKYFGLSTRDFAAIFSQNKLKTPSGHYMLPDFLAKDDEDDLKRTVEDSHVMGHDFFTIPYLQEAQRKSLDDYKKLAEKMNKAGELVKAAGMNLAYHNHNFEFNDWGGGKTGYDILLNGTDPGLVSFEMDIFWVTKAGVDPVKLIGEHPGRFKMWHVKDMDTTPEKSFTEVGTGTINYKEIFKYQKASGMKHWFIEQDQIRGDHFASIAKSLSYLKNNIL